METRKELTSYFPHDSNARNSDKLIRLRMRHKAAGYGVFFMILERLREEPSYMSVKDYNMIAFDLREDASLIKSVIEDFGLFVFTEDGKYFYSESFKKRMEFKDDKSKKRSEAGKIGLAKRWGKKESEIANATKFIANATDNDSNAIAKDEKNIARKEKERKVKKKKELLSSERNKKYEPKGSPLTPSHPGFNPDLVEKPLDECKKILEANIAWIETVCMQQYISTSQFKDYLDEFFKDMACRDVGMKSPKDARSHFASWLKINLRIKSNENSNGTCKQDRDTDRKSRLAGYFQEAFSDCGKSD